MTQGDHPIILFDAECVLCSANARFILRYDTLARFRFVSMQGEFGTQLCREHGLDPRDPDTIILVENGAARRDSDAVLAIYEGLGWPWRAARVLRIVPRAFRDRLYRLVASNRYRLFGKRETCWIPPEQFRDRLL